MKNLLMIQFSGKNFYQDLDSLITKGNYRIPEGKSNEKAVHKSP